MDRLYSESDIVITIVAPVDALEDVPDYISETSQNDAVDFDVVSKPLPDQRRIFELLRARFGEITLSAYRHGHGRFFVSEVEPPVMGELINLSETPHVSQVLIEEYFDALEKHDWFFSYSDDRNVSAQGAKEEARLSAIAQVQGGDFLKLMRAFRAYHFSGQAWNKPQAPKPLRPAGGELRFDLAPAATQDEPEYVEPDEDVGCHDTTVDEPTIDSMTAKEARPRTSANEKRGSASSGRAITDVAPEQVNWEVASALDVYKAWLVRASYRSWSHQLLCWAGSAAARDIDAELTMAEQRAREIVNRSKSHTAAAKLIASRETCAPQDAAYFLTLFASC